MCPQVPLPFLCSCDPFCFPFFFQWGPPATTDTTVMPCGLAWLLVAAAAWAVASPAEGCNKALCASDVSKCLLQVRFQERNPLWGLDLQTGTVASSRGCPELFSVLSSNWKPTSPSGTPKHWLLRVWDLSWVHSPGWLPHGGGDRLVG